MNQGRPVDLLDSYCPESDQYFRDAVYYPLMLALACKYLYSVRPEMVDFGSERGPSVFETGGITSYLEDFKKAKTKRWAKRCRFWMGTI